MKFYQLEILLLKRNKLLYCNYCYFINDENRTVVIVSHSSKTLTDLCDRVIWLHEGNIVKDGKPSEVVGEYEEFLKNQI